MSHHDKEHEHHRESVPDDPELLRTEIEHTREELGDTVEALAHKADVKGRVTDTVDARRQQAKEQAVHVRETVARPENRAPLIVAGTVAALIVLVGWRRSRR